MYSVNRYVSELLLCCFGSTYFKSALGRGFATPVVQLSWYLGCAFERDRKKGVLRLSQRAYVESVVSRRPRRMDMYSKSEINWRSRSAIHNSRTCSIRFSLILLLSYTDCLRFSSGICKSLSTFDVSASSSCSSLKPKLQGSTSFGESLKKNGDNPKKRAKG